MLRIFIITVPLKTLAYLMSDTRLRSMISVVRKIKKALTAYSKESGIPVAKDRGLNSIAYSYS